MPQVMVELDSRRRANLGRVGRHARYLVTELDDGTLILEPAVVMTELQAAFLAHPHIAALIDHSRAHPEQMRLRKQRDVLPTSESVTPHG